MGAFLRLLQRYGQSVELRGPGAPVVTAAFLQPVLERREDWRQSLPTPLGEVRQDRFLYLGPPEQPLEGRTVRWKGLELEVLATQGIWIGRRCSHQWAVLRVRGSEEGET